MAAPPLFFLHFPRTGGTTIDEIFASNYPAESILRIYSREDFKKYAVIEEKDFLPLRYITGHLLLTSTNPTQFYGKDVRAFTFLREPVKRLYSEYIFLKTWKQQHLYSYLNDNNISFSQYITSTEQPLKWRGKNFMTRCISGEALETTDLSEALEKAKDNLKNSFMAFGLQERFMESLLLLAPQAGLANILHQKRNALKYGAATPKLTAEEEEIAREYNSADAELYAWAATLFDERVREQGPEFRKRLKDALFLNEKYQKISNLLYESVTQDEDAGIALSKDVRW
ncbi:MAG: sulfotransferase family 2 domain-containing protein [Desulfovibrio sp.]|nr:sulfotransferase family 2 domain-containing protein [Desulfovibrio sp.]